MASELSYETSDDTSENELLERSLSVWRGWSAIVEDFTPIALDIHTACSIGHYEWVRTIIRKNEGIDLDRKNHGGWTPLMYACYIGHDNIVSLLINAGCCNMNAKNPRGLTPLMLAASCGNESVARLLIRRGANIELLDKSGWTALFHATYAGHQNFVAFLLEAKANKDAVDPNTGLTPFMVAASEGHEIIVQLFLQNGVNAHAKAFNGDMARSLALLNGYMKIVSLIDNQDLPSGRLRAEADLGSGPTHERGAKRRGMPHSQACPLNKAQSPSIRDGPEAIARMISRSRQPDGGTYTDLEVPRGYVTFPAPQEDRKETRLSYRDVTSPINQEDYRDSSGSRDFDDFNDDSNAFTKTGAITIKSSSSSSGGLMAALGLSLDSDDGLLSCSGKFDDEDNDAAKAVKGDGLHKCGRESATENEQLEYDVDGDSSRPVDSHSPSLNDTSSLSSSDQRQKCNIDDKTAAKQADGKTTSALKDYFPMDSSFPPSSNVQPQDRVRNLSEVPQKQHLKAASRADGYLPKENMSQTEIVNRFLNNLSLDSSEGVPEGCDSCLHPVSQPEEQSPETAQADDSGIQDPQCTCTSELEIMEDLAREKQTVATDNVLKGPAVTNYVKNLGSRQKHIPGAHPTSHESLSYPAGLSPSSTSQPGKEVAPQSQQWAPHPPLNHHHPLHNRHKHNQYYSSNTLPGMQDAHSNMYSILTPPNPLNSPASQKQTGLGLPYLNNLPQQYFYSDLHPAPYTHLQPSFTQAPYQPLPSDDPVAGNIGHVYTVNSGSQHEAMPLAAANPTVTTSTAAAPLKNKDGAVPVLSVPELAAGEPLGKPSSGALASQTGGIQPTPLAALSSQQPPPLPAVSMPLAAITGQQPPPLPVASPGTPAAASPGRVIIPGHLTSQPISAAQVPSSALQLPGPAPTSSDDPQDLRDMLSQLSLLKYLDKFEEQDVDLQVFLSLTDNDLKELGIKLFGPRKKMTNAIARWHSCAPAAKTNLEQTYADKLEGEMQEMAIQLNQAYENEERLKAQVSQEQQLRSVTESCLMEERSGWERACQLLQTTRGKLRTLGEQQSRLRHYQKELRKQFEVLAAEGGSNNNVSNNSSTGNDNNSNNLHPFQPNQISADVVSIGDGRELTHPESAAGRDGISSRGAPKGTTTAHAAAEQMKRSDRCLKEMMQTLSALVLNTDHILKSTQSLGSMSKDVT